MSLTKCPACGKDVSTQAVSCPNCAHPLAKSKPKQTSHILGICAVLGFVVLGIALISEINTVVTPKENSPETASAYDACYMTQKFVSSRLKAPATADFQPCYEASTSPKTGGSIGTEYTVSSYVDSQNSFGAKIRSNYLAVVEYEGHDQWSLNALTIEGKTWTRASSPPAPAPLPPASQKPRTDSTLPGGTGCLHINADGSQQPC
jgi:hypothetical protein